jgi:phage tail-like protein
MARSQAQDFLQGFRFHVEMSGDGENYLTLDADTAVRPGGRAGFQSCTLPEVSAEVTEYREGTMKYTRKFNGVATVTDVSLMRGLALNDSALFSWMMDAVGGGEHRRDISIKQYTRAALFAPSGANAALSDPNEGDYVGAAGADQARSYNCFECIPTRCKPGADLDATSAEVSVQELDIALEYFTITVG